MAQILRHGDDLRSIKKFILIILITHVSFARAALIYKKSLIRYLWLHLPKPGTARSFKPYTQIPQQGAESSGRAGRNRQLQLHFTRVTDSTECGSVRCRKAAGPRQRRLPEAEPHLSQNLHCQACWPAAPWLRGRPSPGDCAASPAAPGSPPVGYAGLFHTAVTSAISYCGSGLT